jgi:leucyl-tRNA synthetase
MTSDRSAQEIAADLGSAGSGGPQVQYRMRDWLISRQRYWGTPIPIVHCQACGIVPVPENELPVLLPDMQYFTPDGSGRSPLGRVPEFVNTVCPQCGGEAQRETDTMGGFACSSWYFLRFTSPHYHAGPFDPQEMGRWMPVDLYVGGTEHAVLHLLYARFWTRALADIGLLPFQEPFSKLMSQGQLLGDDGARMSKSRGNVITPDEIVAEYGADALRIYAIFIAPFEQDAAWNPEGIVGVRRFLNRVWALYTQTDFSEGFDPMDDKDLVRLTHITIRRITERIGSFRFNTMVSALMEFANALSERYRQASWRSVAFQDALDIFMRLLAPAAPYLAEELWARSGGAGSIHDQAWPDWDPQLAAEQVAEIPVQVDGKVRDLIRMPVDEDREYALAAALKSPKVRQYLNGLEPERVFFVPGRVLNLLVKRG